MHDRFSPWALLLIALVLPIAGCTNSQVDSIAVTPTSQSLSVGQTVQLTATGTTGHGSSHPSTTSNVTDSSIWTSSDAAVAGVNSTGLVTAFSAGTATITASINGYTGTIGASSTVTVAASSGTGGTGGTGGTTGTSTGLLILPGSQSVTVPGETTQFLAIGTTSTGATANLTSQVAWSSSSSQIATIGANTGLATAVTAGEVTIVALYSSAGSTITGTATFTVNQGSAEKYTAVTIVPSSESVSDSGQTAQLIALGTLGSNGLEVDVTNSPSIKWASSIPTFATVTSGLTTGNGVVTGVGAGSTTISVQLTNPDGSVVSDTAAVTATSTPAPEPILSLTIIPSSITVNDFQLTGQYLAVATYSTPPYVRDVTNSPDTTWISTQPNIFPVDTNAGGNPGASAGLVTAYGSGSAVIVAETTSTDGTIQSATATFNCPLVLPNVETGSIAASAGSCYPGEPLAATLLETLTIYNEGLNTTNWLVTAPSATNTPNVIHCGPGWAGNGNTGGSVCTGTYPQGTSVVLTAPAQSGTNFGGWSYNCTPSNASGTPLPGPVYWTAAGPNYCVVDLTTNDTVGAIFN